MPSLNIPSSGLSLQTSQGNASKSGSISRDAVGLTLSNEMLEEMIRCVQNGKGLQLSLGENPSISYGSKVQQLQTSDDPFTCDIFQSNTTTNSESSSRAEMSSQLKANPAKGTINVPNKLNHSFFTSLTGRKLMPTAFSEAAGRANIKSTTTTAPAKPAPKPSNTAGTDHALAQLQGALASEQQKKLANTTQIINGNLAAPRRGGPPPKMLTNKSKFLSSKNNSLASDTTRSMPSSPALSGVGSPSLGPTSVPLSQQQAEKDKEARKPVIHLLAVEPLSEKTIQNRLPDVAEQDLNNALRKVGDLNDTTGKWELRKGYWKELDVWAYKYSANEDRQRAIDNAVKQYDKMRLGVSEPQWERLLVKAERGTGKSLSKLQADIAKGVARKNNSQNTDGSGRETPNGDEDLLDEKNLSKVKGVDTARSSSQPPTTKPKKTSEKEAQAKRLFSKNPPKSANKPAPKDKPLPKDKPAAKAAPAPARKGAPAPKSGSKVLSAEYVEDSDEDIEHQVPVKEKPKAKPQPKPQAKPVMKRAREDEPDTSDSSIPLSKKVKKDVPPITTTNHATTASKHRVSDASQTSRATTTSSYSSYNSAKNKSNSPQKSSPLASSPPTNASDMEHSDRTSSSASPASRFSTKNTRSPIHKRHQKSSSVTSSSSGRSRIEPKAIELATTYRLYYPRYVKLFEEVTAEGDKRTKSKERDLLDMHYRLLKMRKEIQSYMAEE
ncbi:uncharacterized protein RAG0_07585 [Rhynchosporium agropyri]|uniref:E3 ubiquitin-protein ligase UBR1-like winged-helix domain-containing protein n=1 Tax=Rhynchosporium agropyri TaxID=914238 RepID=A0A1E1KM53_9HELO|nr:uncharacterized protein RAG0_07585 [Rhynchosporium agropyri]